MCEQVNKNLIQQEQERAEHYKTLLKLETKDGRICLTRKNAAIIETLISLNPRYGKVVDINNHNCAMFFINELKKDNSSYTDNIKEIIRRINSENSTRMSRDEMEIIAERIVDHARTKDILINMLKKRDCSLIDKIAKPVNTKIKNSNKERNRSNFSFATKFCHYMCFYLFEGEEEEFKDNYSIYDNIVINVISKYKDIAGIQKDLLPFNKDADKKETASSYYLYFQEYIDKILDRNPEKLSRYAFDHILWYSSKIL